MGCNMLFTTLAVLSEIRIDHETKQELTTRRELQEQQFPVSDVAVASVSEPENSWSIGTSSKDFSLTVRMHRLDGGAEHAMGSAVLEHRARQARDRLTDSLGKSFGGWHRRPQFRWAEPDSARCRTN